MSEPTWELLGGGGVVGGPIDYVGDWAAGTQYQPGQVVRYSGLTTWRSTRRSGRRRPCPAHVDPGALDLPACESD